MNIIRRKALYNREGRQVCRVSELISLGEFYNTPKLNHWYVLRGDFKSRYVGKNGSGLGNRIPLLVDHGRGIVLGVLVSVYVGSSRNEPIPIRLLQAEQELGSFKAFKEYIQPKIKTGYCNRIHLRYLDMIGEYDSTRNEYFPERKQPLLF